MKKLQKLIRTVLQFKRCVAKVLLSVRVGPHVPAHSTPHLAAHPGEAFLFALLALRCIYLHSPHRGNLCANPAITHILGKNGGILAA